jgi:hypothetical protein
MPAHARLEIVDLAGVGHYRFDFKDSLELRLA